MGGLGHAFPSPKEGMKSQAPHNNTHPHGTSTRTHHTTRRTVLKRLVVHFLMGLQVQMIQQRRGPLLPFAFRLGGQANNKRRQPRSLAPGLGQAWLQGLGHGR